MVAAGGLESDGLTARIQQAQTRTLGEPPDSLHGFWLMQAAAATADAVLITAGVTGMAPVRAESPGLAHVLALAGAGIPDLLRCSGAAPCAELAPTAGSARPCRTEP